MAGNGHQPIEFHRQRAVPLGRVVVATLVDVVFMRWPDCDRSRVPAGNPVECDHSVGVGRLREFIGHEGKVQFLQLTLFFEEPGVEFHFFDRLIVGINDADAQRLHAVESQRDRRAGDFRVFDAFVAVRPAVKK